MYLHCALIFVLSIHTCSKDLQLFSERKRHLHCIYLMWHVQKFHLGHVTKHSGYVIAGACRMKHNLFFHRKNSASNECSDLLNHDNANDQNDIVERRALRSIWLTHCFIGSISTVLRTKVLSHDLNSFWCVWSPSCDENQYWMWLPFWKPLHRMLHLIERLSPTTDPKVRGDFAGSHIKPQQWIIGSKSLIGWNLQSKMCTWTPSKNRLLQLEIADRAPLSSCTLGIQLVLIFSLLQQFPFCIKIERLMTLPNSCKFS